ncbi:MAG: dUTP diphosphatase [Phycisphaerales bacterium]
MSTNTATATRTTHPSASDFISQIKLPGGGRVNAAVVRIKQLDDRAILPQYKSELAAGLDLAACLPRHDMGDTVTIEPGEIVKIPLGYACAIPVGYEGQVRPRSGISTKHGISLPNAPGTIDADYRGEMFIALINLSKVPYTIAHGDRIAQLVIAPVAHATIRIVEELEDTDRGSNGFGSTGI